MCSLERYIVTTAQIDCRAMDFGVTAAVMSGRFVTAFGYSTPRGSATARLTMPAPQKRTGPARAAPASRNSTTGQLR